ncbi:hypothetical protein [Rhodoferax sp. BLA1]|uniref:hypothetical protein n=1 Tax=Rhodoferax sp. BLA1 TaxID=2576062 RepID=UPI0015D17129|nr:hypothetical protein [Rhodoferax sp. BLA1]
MQRLQFVLFQADEAANLLRASSQPRLRTALLLLDNSIELLLDRWIEDQLQQEEIQRKIQTRAMEAGIPRNHPQFADLLSQKFLTADETRQVARFFDEKLKFASVKRGKITAEVAAVLSHIHRYRNESYHGGRVRPGILRTTVAIQLHLVCNLVQSLKPGSVGYSSGDDFSWLKERFDLSPGELWRDQTLNQVLREIMEVAEQTPDNMRRALAENLAARIEALDDTIDFISSETSLGKTAAEVIAAAHSFVQKKLASDPTYPPPPRGIEKSISESHIELARSIPSLLLGKESSVEAFNAFASADASLDLVEYVLGQLAVAIELQIQLEIDLARGK